MFLCPLTLQGKESFLLAPLVVSFEDAVASTVCYRLLLQPCQAGATTTNGSPQQLSAMFCPNSLRGLLRESMSSDVLELGHTMASAIREDVLAVCSRDLATDTVLEVVLFSKGYTALVCLWAAHCLYKEKQKFTVLFLQSQASAVFGLDIRPLAQIGYRVMLDHGTSTVPLDTMEHEAPCTHWSILNPPKELVPVISLSFSGDIHLQNSG